MKWQFTIFVTEKIAFASRMTLGTFLHRIWFLTQKTPSVFRCIFFWVQIYRFQSSWNLASISRLLHVFQNIFITLQSSLFCLVFEIKICRQIDKIQFTNVKWRQWSLIVMILIFGGKFNSLKGCVITDLKLPFWDITERLLSPVGAVLIAEFKF